MTVTTAPEVSKATTEEAEVVMQCKDIIQILPHKHPFLLVDRVLELDLENDRVVAQKNVTMNEGFFQGHFPEAPVMPGVLLLEALAQAGGLLYYKKEATDKIAVLMSVNNAKFRRPVLPGDTVILECTGLHWSANAGKIKGRALVGGKLACEAEIGFVLVDKSVL